MVLVLVTDGDADTLADAVTEAVSMADAELEGVLLELLLADELGVGDTVLVLVEDILAVRIDVGVGVLVELGVFVLVLDGEEVRVAEAVFDGVGDGLNGLHLILMIPEPPLPVEPVHSSELSPPPAPPPPVLTAAFLPGSAPPPLPPLP